ncbi:glycosyltransferase family 2 protein [Vibrio ezurae]|uniref:Putative glycosyltransferase n=1 Tax=Vibrio ezurae NBRC 102218 TaxID=1219080 RepID=U3CH10_9VIBR|nr:glycosyltransferase family 2 protein [Vibrio ezurae]GAD80499.1 putative glycosyltransferase [Vibrio ezurae NBRC 102218]
MKKTVSIVIPCYNESEVIDVTVEELLSVTNNIANYQFELIFVNDGSADDTEAKLLVHGKAHDNIRVISFSRNFGHQQAVSAGLDVSTGDAVVLIDADLQDPPKLIEDMIAKWEEGFDVVYGTRSSRDGESKFKLMTAKWFYRLLNYLSEVKIPLDTGDFRLMDRQVVDHLIAMPEKSRFIRGMVSWIGFNQTSINYERSARFAGESKYPLTKMLKFGIDGILSFSVKPLKLSIMMGFACSGVAMLMLLYSVYIRLMTDHWESGWASLLVAILFIGGVQLISIGILGEYIARIYNESKDRPLYIIKKNRDHNNRDNNVDQNNSTVE